MKGCIAIPIHDQHGVLVAYAGRRLARAQIEGLGKYKFPRRFHKQAVLFNLHRTDPGEHLVLVEGFFSVMLLTQMGLRGVIGAMGCSLSAHQANLIASQEPRHITILFDGDDAGRRGAERARCLLSEALAGVPVEVFELAHGREPEDLTPAEIDHLKSG